jgi:predicted ATPase
LTDQHLKDLGVSLGHRLKMLRAIRDLSGASIAAPAPAAPVATAHDLLAPVYGWFTEGVDTLDLREATALLDQLA